MPNPSSALINADLHCHSVVSDGTLTPEQLAARAKGNGVQLWSLTDHDEVGGQKRAAAAANEHGMAYLTGCEISVTFAGHTVHIVGLGFDADNPQLREGLAQTRGGRGKRAMEMSQSAGFGRSFAKFFVPGIISMTVSFFLTLGLLQHFDLSYLYPFQGLSVIIVSVTASVLLKEKLTLQLTLGALLISAGIVLVSLS